MDFCPSITGGALVCLCETARSQLSQCGVQNPELSRVFGPPHEVAVT